MEPPAPHSPYVSQNSKKRVFPGTSSSAGFNDVEVLEMSPPITRRSKSKSLKQKEVIHHEIIDVDLLEDRTHEIIDVDLLEDRTHEIIDVDLLEDRTHEIIDVDLEEDDGAGSGTGKEALPNLKVGHNNVQMTKNDDSVSNLLHGADDWVGLKRKQASDLENNTLPHLVKRRSSSRLTLSPPQSNANTSLSMPSTSSYMPGPVIEDSTYIQKGKTPSKVEQRNVDVILQNFDLFDKFATVEDYSDHHFSKHGSSAKQPPKNWAKRIQEEWKILQNDLPEKIFVRVYESRMDLLRAVIVGAEGTPYHDGLFFFDVYFPSTYPHVPPHVHYHSGGLRINPNLYNCGKVCLSLLNTWGGDQKEKWIPGVSTMLQVLVSIQGLILNVKPYFNEPVYARSNGSKNGEKNSLKYNESTFMLSLQTMVYNMRRPPKCFEPFVVGHFYKHARDILVSCKAYLDGAHVGSLVKGGVQDVNEVYKRCSKDFRTNLANFITTLVNTFSQIGAKDCQEFLSLSQKDSQPAPRQPSRRRS